MHATISLRLYIHVDVHGAIQGTTKNVHTGMYHVFAIHIIFMHSHNTFTYELKLNRIEI